MSNKHRSRPRSADSADSQKQKPKQKFSISALVSNAVPSRQLSKTPIYNHNPREVYFTGNRVQSDFVYIPPIISKTLNNTTKSDTCHERRARKKIRRVPVDSASIDKKDDKVAITEKLVLKKTAPILTAEPSRKDNSSAVFIHEKREVSRYKLTDEDIKRIQSTMPPGEVVIVPRTLTRVWDRRGCAKYTSQPAVARKCLCNPEKSVIPDLHVKTSGILKISPSDGASKAKLTKRSVSFITDKHKGASFPKKKKTSSGTDDKNRKTPKGTSNKKRTGLKDVQDRIDKILSKDVSDHFIERQDNHFQNAVKKKVEERKVDEGDPYKALISASTGRLNRSQYQLYFNLRIRGRSVLHDLTFDPVQIYSVSIKSIQ